MYMCAHIIMYAYPCTHNTRTLTHNSHCLFPPGVPKLNLSPVQKYAERLKELYSKRKMPDYLKGRQLRTAKFVSLALISCEGVSKEEMDEFTRGTVQDGDIDAILMQEISFRDETHWKAEDWLVSYLHAAPRRSRSRQVHLGLEAVS